MIDQQIEIPTGDGRTTTFITHPERDGPHPVILFYMDAPAIREELRDMARRLGAWADRKSCRVAGSHRCAARREG
jgi:carboxymethylenebutenolidase